MGYKISSTPAPSPIIRIANDQVYFSLEDFLASKKILTAKVIESLAVNNEYLLNFSGKKLKLFSETKLFVGEELKLRVNKDNLQIQLEIMGRTSQSNESASSLELDKAWSKSYYSPLKMIYAAIESNESEVSFNKLYQFLNVFFPGIEWNDDVSQFQWKFQDGEASGFYGKREDVFGFYFNFQSICLGSIDSYLQWQKDDFSDFRIRCVFDNLSAYLFANENLFELKKMLSSNSIFPNDIIFHYSSFKKERGDWIA